MKLSIRGKQVARLIYVDGEIEDLEVDKPKEYVPLAPPIIPLTRSRLLEIGSRAERRRRLREKFNALPQEAG